MTSVNESISMTERCQCPQHCRTTPPRHPEPETDNPIVPDEISKSVLEALTKNLDSWERYFSGMVTIAIFGGQITFTIVLSDIYDPRKVFERESPPFLEIDKEKVRVFVALAFMFFTITLSAAAVGKIILANPTTKTQILRSLQNKSYSPLEWFTIAACCIDYFPMLAFLFLGLAVSAYVPGVGLTVAIIFFLSLLCKMYWGHVVIPDNRKSWSSVKLVAASALWKASS